MLSALLFLMVFVSQSTKAAGVTIITHGYELTGEYPTWVTAMADEIPPYFHYVYPGLNTNFTIYKMTITYNDNSYFFSVNTNGFPPSTTDCGEIIIELDWSSLSGTAGLLDSYASTYNVGWAVAQILMLTNAVSELNGHPLVEFPIHLIGHSRGGSLMSQISYVLGTNGIWVDHLTTLDPHPLNNDGNVDTASYSDASAQNTYTTVLFHDNYWQDLGTGLDFDGEQVSGAYNRQLLNLVGGYNDSIGGILGLDAPYHSNVHLWYHGTIDFDNPASDGNASIGNTERTDWWTTYEDFGVYAGFYYSLIGGGNRMSTEEPLGGPNDPEIVDGYNQWWDFGAGSSANRTPLTSNSGAWPNLIQFNVVGTNIVMAGQPIVTKFYYQYGGASNLVTAQFYYDRDLNPYNTNSTPITSVLLPNTGVDSVYYDAPNLATTNVPPGAYAIYGKISDGAHTRYLYAPEIVQIVSSTQPPVLGISEMNSSQFVIGVSGVVGQKIILQTSTDLQNWLPLMTNTLTSGAWFYTNNVSPNFSGQFYRAILNP